MLISVREQRGQGANRPPSLERRQETRHVATYRPCCLIHHDQMSMGLLRNLSGGGACVEIDLAMEPGDTVKYFWEEKSAIVAKVIWKDGNRYGLSHVNEVVRRQLDFPLRSVRVPCDAEAFVWIGGNRTRATVENISMGGMRLNGLPPLNLGEMMTICFCGLEIEAASTRWSRDRNVGVRFSKRLSRQQIANLLVHPEFSFTGIDLVR